MMFQTGAIKTLVGEEEEGEEEGEEEEGEAQKHSPQTPTCTHTANMMHTTTLFVPFLSFLGWREEGGGRGEVWGNWGGGKGDITSMYLDRSSDVKMTSCYGSFLHVSFFCR